MGKTVPAYRLALEFEINTWRGFKKALTSDEDKQAFEEMMDLCRIFASESSMATNPIIFEPWPCRFYWVTKGSCANLSIDF